MTQNADSVPDIWMVLPLEATGGIPDTKPHLWNQNCPSVGCVISPHLPPNDSSRMPGDE